MAGPGDPNPVRAYYIQHVQTGAEFRSANLEEVTRWMTTQNLAYIPGAVSSGEEEGAQS